MRIQHIRFKNLNSLVGEWAINLDHPAFSNDGIFAITGATGAGKTTILDAICLALYGRTPRLAKINKSANDIMSRQTGECFAEVVFSNHSGQYRCTWSQRRSRRKNDGELQTPKHEIAEAVSGKTLEEKLQRTSKCITKITGMDFDRFTRSMLLAQGGFAAFLQASPDDRSDILEQITGTEIYSEISKRVHSMRQQEQQKLDTLNASLEGVQLLSPEQVQNLQVEQAQKNQLEIQLNREINDTQQHLKLRDTILSLEQEQALIRQQIQNVENQGHAFAPQQQDLEQDARALALAGKYAQLSTLRQAQEKDQREYAQNQHTLPATQQALKEAEVYWQQTQSYLQQQKDAHSHYAPILVQVRALDVNIHAQNKIIAQATQDITAKNAAINTQQTQNQEYQTQLKFSENALNQLNIQLDNTQAHATLIEQFSRIDERCQSLKQFSHQHFELSNQYTQNQAQLKRAENTNRLALDKQGQQTLVVEQSKASLINTQTQLEQVLEQQSITYWREQLSQLQQDRPNIEALQQANHQSERAQKHIAELGQQQLGLERCIEQGDNALKLAQTELHHLDNAIAALDNELDLLRTIKSLEEQRQHLQDGEPCPLCGAQEHPYSHASLPKAEQTQSTRQQKKAEIQAKQTEITRLNIRQAEDSKDLENNKNLIAQQQQTIIDNASAHHVLCTALTHILPNDFNQDTHTNKRQEILAALLLSNTTTTQQLSDKVQQAEALTQHIDTTQTQLYQAGEALNHAQRQAQDATYTLQATQAECLQISKHRDEIQEEISKSLSALESTFDFYGLGRIEIHQLDNALTTLGQQRDLWQSRQAEKQQLEAAINNLSANINYLEQAIIAADQTLKSSQKIQDDQQSILATLRQERHNIFGEKDPNQEEAQLNSTSSLAEQSEQLAQKGAQQAQHKHVLLNTRINSLLQSIHDRKAEIDRLEEAFFVLLETAGFKNEAALQAAQLDPQAREAIQQQANHLNKQRIELDSRNSNNQTQLEQVLAQQLKSPSPNQQLSLNELNQQLTQQQEAHSALQQSLGAIRQQLQNHSEQQQVQAEKMQLINAQSIEASRWNLLHDLIGSSDGKKFRNFAQGLTFELMIYHANKQLQKMSDRYLLLHHSSKALELNVMDNHQAGEVRTTKNLSGGESFIVSLALALGLSNMVSKNVRVDSLFLDEGFGTLDEDALDTALTTLASLQHEGKLIGVISHVAALKARIATQIQIKVGSGGRSSIVETEGVKRIST